jgi:hypothetical protein
MSLSLAIQRQAGSELQGAGLRVKVLRSRQEVGEADLEGQGELTIAHPLQIMPAVAVAVLWALEDLLEESMKVLVAVVVVLESLQGRVVMGEAAGSVAVAVAVLPLVVVMV